jgi:GT2 family glycosyltransferase
MMIPRRVLDEVGLLDEDFFYGSDVEWARRAAKAGYRFLSLSDGEVVHHGKGSRQGQHQLPPQFAGGPAVQALYYRKHHGLLGVLLFRCLLIAGSLPRLILWEIVHLLGRSHEADDKRAMFRRLIAAAWTFRADQTR